jgi:nucleoside phosphorylase
VNIGVGPSNAKTITDHLAVLRPHCWLMIGHGGGLWQSQTIGDYVLAHGYLRRDRILDDLVPPGVPIPALAEIGVTCRFVRNCTLAKSSMESRASTSLHSGTASRCRRFSPTFPCKTRLPEPTSKAIGVWSRRRTRDALLAVRF